MSKWHDITEAGDPQDLPTCDDTNNYIVTTKSLDGDISVMVFDGEMIHECAHGTYKDNPRVIAWRKMPRAYVPGKRKPKPLMFEHDVTLKCVAPVHPGSYPVLADNGERVADILWRTVDILLGKHAAIRTNEANGKPVHFKIYLTEIEQDKQ